MLKDILEKNITVIQDETMTWEESIRKASFPILEKKHIEERYIDAMIDDIGKHGFYVVLRDGLAMPHSRPENGVNQTTLALLKTNTFIDYGEHKIKLVFVLASRSSTEHIEVIKKLSDLFQNDEDIERLMNSNTEKEITNILSNY